ncbi:class I adenylate-forming enzyme family protein [Mesobacterium pallidum]|uniref:class I adenylate-forming enzyme family protein n=1 Tax=Mesobacterium pallidum TaxID=2872037 RepID=UPI001EE1CCF1|nr:AMP-binding protein [Mesobacterium pallidum]
MTQAPFTESYFPKYETGPLIESTLGDMMLRNAAEVPDRLALVEGIADPAARRRWTFAELAHDAQMLARALLEQFEPGDRIGLLAPETPEWVLFQQALSFAGLVNVPINPAYTAREVEFVLATSEAAGVIHADESRGKNLAAIVETVMDRLDHLHTAINVAEMGAMISGADPDRALPDLDPGDMLQIQYTSGTTGFPKGACLHHRGVINAAHFIVERADFPVGGIWLNTMPMFHVGGSIVSEIGVYSRQGTFILMPAFDPALFLQLIEEEGVQSSLIVPTMILALLNHPDFKTRDMSTFNSILSGAAAVPEALVKRAKAEFGVQFAIMYGQTESNGPFLETFTSDSDELQATTIGRPIPHVEVKVVDPVTHETLPVGAIGEWWVRGFNTMLGYYNKPEETAAALTPDGWLRTGDLGAMDAQGYFRITGRLKEMIIRGGMNLYPAEIENVIFEHEAVGQVAVIGLPDETWGETVCAVVQAKDIAAPPDCAALWSYCRTRLSPQKTPEHWIFVEQFPMTPTGKIQKNVLLEMCADGRLAPAAWSRPQRDSQIA